MYTRSKSLGGRDVLPLPFVDVLLQRRPADPMVDTLPRPYVDVELPTRLPYPGLDILLRSSGNTVATDIVQGLAGKMTSEQYQGGGLAVPRPVDNVDRPITRV